MSSTETERIRAAAVQALTAERCRPAFLHDVRGGLQAISGAFDVLTRLARKGEVNSEMVEKVSAMARRALVNHEHSMLGMIRQITCEDDTASEVELGGLMDEVARLLRNDVAGKALVLQVVHPERCLVQARKHKLQLALTGLLTVCIDDCPHGGEFSVVVSHADRCALVEFDFARSASMPIENCTVPPRDLVIDTTRQWLVEHGGRLEVDDGESGRRKLAFLYPLPE